MRIAFVSLMAGMRWGGSEALWHSVAKEALVKGDEVFVSIYDWGELHPKVSELKKLGARIHARKRFNPYAGKLEMMKRFFINRNQRFNKDYQSIISFKPDVVFISQGDSFDLAIHHRSLYQLLRQNNIYYSIVCHSHEQYSFIPGREIYPAAQEVFLNASKVYFVSERQRRLTERRLICRLTNAAFTWNPLNMEFPAQPLVWPEGKTLKLAMVGGLNGNKGQDTAIEVLGSEIWKHRDWQLNIYGEGAGLNYLESLASFFQINDRVIFHGHVSDLIEVWKLNQVLIISSSAEGMPISLVEAMASGRAALVTDVGGNIELVSNNETGFVACSPTTEAVSEAMERLWENRNELKEMGEKSRAVMMKTFEKRPQDIIYRDLVNTKKI